jgi:restriction system protein
MRNFYRIMLGAKSVYAKICLEGGFIGANWDIDQDLSQKLPDNWRAFNQEFNPVYLAAHPDKSRISAGLACGMLWTICKKLQRGDIVLSPDGTGTYMVGEIIGDYSWHPGAGDLAHQRAVRWFESGIPRVAMSEALRNSAGSVGTVSDISRHRDELERLLSGHVVVVVPPEEQEEASSFGMEKHLEEFLVSNWAQTELGRDYDIFEEDGELKGQQYLTDTGPLDILAISKDRKELLVVELKRGRASDMVVGQILRYMGYVQDQVATAQQSVRGAIIALEDDQRIRRALSMTPNITFYRYQVSFKLVRA